MLSTGVAGSNITRLLKQGEDGNTVEIVADSWTAKPGARSSRSITLRVPPGFPAGIGVGDGVPAPSALFLAAGFADWAVAICPAGTSSAAAAIRTQPMAQRRSEGRIESSFVGERVGWARLYASPPGPTIHAPRGRRSAAQRLARPRAGSGEPSGRRARA